jgi:hypothetical protein
MANTMPQQVAANFFPESAVTTALEQWWDKEVKGRSTDPFAKPGTLYDTVVEMDSLSVVNVLVTIEKIVGFELPVTIVKRGGHRDRQEMVDHMVPGIRSLFMKQRNITPMRNAKTYAK